MSTPHNDKEEIVETQNRLTGVLDKLRTFADAETNPDVIRAYMEAVLYGAAFLEYLAIEMISGKNRDPNIRQRIYGIGEFCDAAEQLIESTARVAP